KVYLITCVKSIRQLIIQLNNHLSNTATIWIFMLSLHDALPIFPPKIMQGTNSPDGTLFKYDQLQLRQEVRMHGRPVIVDNLIVRPDDESAPVRSMLFMDGRTHLGSLLAVDARIDAELVAELREKIADALEHIGTMTPTNKTEGSKPDALFGITLVDVPGLAVLVLGTKTEQNAAALYAVFNDMRARWRDQGTIHLRKY